MPDASAILAHLTGGVALPGPLVDRLSNAYGHDLSGVRVHAGSAKARDLGARAFTVGQDMAFAPGEYRPGTTEGDRLIGHEAAHVVQQAGGAGAVQGAGLSSDGYEQEADRASATALAGGAVQSLTPLGAGRVQKEPAPSAGAAPGGEPLARYSHLRKSISPEDWARLNKAAQAREISWSIAQGSGDAALRDQLKGEGAAELEVPVSKLLPAPQGAGEGGWKPLVYQGVVGGDTTVAGNAVRDEVIRRWLDAFPETGGELVRVALIDPDGLAGGASTLTFQYREKPLTTIDGSVGVGEIDAVGMDAAKASVEVELGDVPVLENLSLTVDKAIGIGRSMIQDGHKAVSADEVSQWSATLAELQGRVTAFGGAHADAAAAVQTLSSRLDGFIKAEATPFAEEHTEWLKKNQRESVGDVMVGATNYHMEAGKKQLRSEHWYERVLAGLSFSAAGRVAGSYGTVDMMTGGNIESSRQFHQAFREGHISLDGLERGSREATTRGAIVGGLTAILTVASMGLAGPVLGTAPSLLRVSLYSGGAAAFSTAAVMSASTVYTRQVSMGDPSSQQIWDQGAYTPEQIAISSVVAFGVGAALGAVTHVLSRVPQSNLRALALASAEGKALTPIPGVQVQNIRPGVVRLSIEGQPGYVEVTLEGYAAFAPAGAGGKPTLVDQASWVVPEFNPFELQRNPFLADVQGLAGMSTGQQGMVFGTTSRGYFAYAPRTSTPFLEGPLTGAPMNGSTALVPYSGRAPLNLGPFAPTMGRPAGGLPGQVPPAGAPPIGVPPINMAPATSPQPFVVRPDGMLVLNRPGGVGMPITEQLLTPGVDAFTGGMAYGRVAAATPGLALRSQVRIARAIAQVPGLLDTPRSTLEIEAMLAKINISVQPEEQRALREVIYKGLNLEVTSTRQGLDSFLDRVWSDRTNILARAGAGEKPVYDLYSAGTEPNVLQSPSDYFKAMSKIAMGRSGEAVSHIQGISLPKEGDQISAAVQAYPPEKIGRKFYMYFRAKTIKNMNLTVSAQERIYLNVRADRATAVMQEIVANVVDAPELFPKVVGAKLTGPLSVGERADAIVIYLEDASAASAVLDWVRGYRGRDPSAFMTATPPMTEQIVPGVSVGAEPLPRHEGASFGGLRSQLIQKALLDTMNGSGARAEFDNLVRKALQDAEIDPARPHLNQPKK